MNFDSLTRQALADACATMVPRAADAACPLPTDELRMAAMVCFSGERVQGAFGIAATVGGLERIRARFDTVDTHTGRAEALCELATLVLEYVRQIWSRHDVLVEPAAPILLRGVALDLPRQGSGKALVHQSGLGGDRISMWFELHHQAEIELRDGGRVGGGELQSP